MEKVKLGGAVILGNRGQGTLPPVPSAPAVPQQQPETAQEKLARLQAETAALEKQVAAEKAEKLAALEKQAAAIAAEMAALKPPAPVAQPAAAPLAARQPNRVYPGFANQKAAIRWHYAQAGAAGLTLAQLSEKLGLPKGETRSNYSKALVASGHLVRLSASHFAHTPACLPMPS